MHTGYATIERAMYTIVGLGNPGTEYKNTRHNLGWIVLNGVVEKESLPSFVKSGTYTSLLSEGVLHGKEVGILLPTTYMNNSGVATAKYVHEHGSLDTLIVVHDDIHLPFGDVRVSVDRGAGGHNGIRSIIDSCGSQKFVRIRLGIAQKGFFGNIKRPVGEALSKYVLAEFKSGDVLVIPTIVDKANTALEHILKKGVAYAMQECNGDA